MKCSANSPSRLKAAYYVRNSLKLMRLKIKKLNLIQIEFPGKKILLLLLCTVHGADIGVPVCFKVMIFGKVMEHIAHHISIHIAGYN